jgi:hypothetical protein
LVLNIEDNAGPIFLGLLRGSFFVLGEDHKKLYPTRPFEMGTSSSASASASSSSSSSSSLSYSKDHTQMDDGSSSILIPGVVPSHVTYVLPLPPIAVVPSTTASVREETAATESYQLEPKFKSNNEQNDSENEDWELSDDSPDDKDKDRKPPAKESVPSYKINMAPNGVSEREESDKYWYAVYRKSVLARSARTQPTRVKTTDRNDMIVVGVAVTPDRHISHDDVSVTLEMDHRNIGERCTSPDLSDNDQYIGDVAWTEEEQSNDEDDNDDDDVMPPPAPKRRRRHGPCKELIHDGFPHHKEGIDWTGWTQQQFRRTVRWSHCLLTTMSFSPTPYRCRVLYLPLELTIRDCVRMWIIFIHTPVPTGSFVH